MLEPVAVPFLVFAALVVACGFLLVLRPYWRRRRERREREAFDLGPANLAIRLRPFQLLRPAGAVSLLMADPRIKKAVAARAAEAGVSRSAAAGEARRYAREIVPALRAGFYSRMVQGPIREILFRLFRVQVRHADEIALRALSRGATPVFVMNHRSNFDYVIAAVALRHRVIPSFAVGEWARYWPLEPFLRSLGGYFVRRNSNNPLYRAVLASYVGHATRLRVPQAFFVEGRLSSNGTMGKPRLGLLDYAVRALTPDEPKDIAFIPAAVNYDRVIEDKNLQFLKAKGWTPTRFRSWRASSSFLVHQLWLRLSRRWRPFGGATLVLGKPIGLRAWLRAEGVASTEAPREERFDAVRRLADQLMGAIADLMPVLPVPLMASVVRDAPSPGITAAEARAAAFLLLEKLTARRGAPDIPRADWGEAVEFGVRLLVQRRMVRAADGRLRILDARRPLLEYYANSIAHLVG